MYVTSRRIFSIHPNDHSTGSLASRASQLLEDQMKSWPQLSDGYAALASVRTREIVCNGFNVLLQYNPKRIVSTAAPVDHRSIQARPCFLCDKNLPPEQKGILFADKYLVLGNPAPIFSEHFTISSTKHTPQELEPAFADFLELVRSLSPAYTVFYNGPRCGASAPDHLHFQAAPTGSIPVEREAIDAYRRRVLRKTPAVAALTLKNYGRPSVVIESTDSEAMTAFVGDVLSTWRKAAGVAGEPMLNVLGSYRQAVWRLIIFPRKKHRPAVYYLTTPDQVLVSPAAVDLGGLVVTPLEKDFLAVDAKQIESIYAEVCLEPAMIEEIVAAA